jgi:hypothetical protein
VLVTNVAAISDDCPVNLHVFFDEYGNPRARLHALRFAERLELLQELRRQSDVDALIFRSHVYWHGEEVFKGFDLQVLFGQERRHQLQGRQAADRLLVLQMPRKVGDNDTIVLTARTRLRICPNCQTDWTPTTSVLSRDLRVNAINYGQP